MNESNMPGEIRLRIQPEAPARNGNPTGPAAKALIIGSLVAARAFASGEAGGVDADAFTPDRLVATAGALAALVAAIVGGLSAARATVGRGRRGMIVALVLGSLGLITGLFIIMTADGGLGTGNGVGGGYVAIVLSLIGIALAGLTLFRTRRTA